MVLPFLSGTIFGVSLETLDGGVGVWSRAALKSNFSEVCCSLKLDSSRAGDTGVDLVPVGVDGCVSGALISGFASACLAISRGVTSGPLAFAGAGSTGRENTFPSPTAAGF